VFSELSVPLLGNPTSPHEAPRLELAVAGRYERYSDFGDTFNPTTRLVWSAYQWLKLRGGWGRSFRAPTLDNLNDSAQNGSGLAVLPDPQSVSGRSLVVVEQGNNPDLKQQTATTWTTGFDVTPTFLPGSRLSVTYYSIDYRNQISQPAAADPMHVLVNANEWSSIITRNPTPQEIASACAWGISLGPRSVCISSSPAAIVNLKLANLSLTKVSGLDVEAHQSLETPLGSFGFGVTGAYQFYFDQGASPTAPVLDILNTVGNPLAMRLRATLDWSQHGIDGPGFGANLGFSYTGAYRDPNSTTVRNIDALATVDLQLRYRSPESGWWSHTELILNAVNLLNQSPPFVDDEFGYDRFNTQPLGRVVALSLKKSW
jgi:outer membrane receptor protein involved in Fe transport